MPKPSSSVSERRRGKTRSLMNRDAKLKDARIRKLETQTQIDALSINDMTELGRPVFKHAAQIPSWIMRVRS